jgi:hypothetical protein
MNRIAIATLGTAFLVMSACSSESTRTTENKVEVRDAPKITTADGSNVPIYTIVEGTAPAKVAEAPKTTPTTDRDAYLSRTEEALRALRNRVDLLRDRAGLHAKYNVTRLRLRRSVNGLEIEVTDARRELNTLRLESDAAFNRDRAHMDRTIDRVRSDVDRVAAE